MHCFPFDIIKHLHVTHIKVQLYKSRSTVVNQNLVQHTHTCTSLDYGLKMFAVNKKPYCNLHEE